MGLMFPAVVLAVVRPGAAAGADQGAVQQDDDPALLCDLLQGAVQARGAGGQQTQDFLTQRRTVEADAWLPPAISERRWSWRRTASTISALGTGGDLAPAGAEPVALAAYQITDEVEGPLRHWKSNLVDSILRALGGAGCLHKHPNFR